MSRQKGARIGILSKQSCLIVSDCTNIKHAQKIVKFVIIGSSLDFIVQGRTGYIASGSSIINMSEYHGKL